MCVHGKQLNWAGNASRGSCQPAPPIFEVQLWVPVIISGVATLTAAGVLIWLWLKLQQPSMIKARGPPGAHKPACVQI